MYNLYYTYSNTQITIILDLIALKRSLESTILSYTWQPWKDLWQQLSYISKQMGNHYRTSGNTQTTIIMDIASQKEFWHQLYKHHTYRSSNIYICNIHPNSGNLDMCAHGHTDTHIHTHTHTHIQTLTFIYIDIYIILTHLYTDTNLLNI